MYDAREPMTLYYECYWVVKWCKRNHVLTYLHLQSLYRYILIVFLQKNKPPKKTTTTCWEFQNRHTFQINLSNFTLTYKTLQQIKDIIEIAVCLLNFYTSKNMGFAYVGLKYLAVIKIPSITCSKKPEMFETFQLSVCGGDVKLDKLKRKNPVNIN